MNVFARWWHRTYDRLALPSNNDQSDQTASAHQDSSIDKELLNLPRYPPFAKGMPAIDVGKILWTQEDLILQLQRALGLTPAYYEELVAPAIANYAGFVHLLPASENHHHRGAGGLFRHGLEVAYYAAMSANGVIFSASGTPNERRQAEPMWRVACSLAGLCHDVGKAMTDVRVGTREGQLTWNPYRTSLIDWLSEYQVDRYFISWNQRRHKNHENFAALAINQIVTPQVLGRLNESGSDILKELLVAVSGMGEINPVARQVLRADQASVQKDLKQNRLDIDQYGYGVPIERYVVDALRRLVSSAKLKVNEPGAAVWHAADGTYLVWKPVLQAVHGLLRDDNIPGIPKDPNTLADILIERGIAEPGCEDTEIRFHKVIPKLESGLGKQVQMVLVTLKVLSEYVFANEKPVPVELVQVNSEEAEKRYRAGGFADGADRTEGKAATGQEETFTTEQGLAGDDEPFPSYDGPDYALKEQSPEDRFGVSEVQENKPDAHPSSFKTSERQAAPANRFSSDGPLSNAKPAQMQTKPEQKQKPWEQSFFFSNATKQGEGSQPDPAASHKRNKEAPDHEPATPTLFDMGNMPAPKGQAEKGQITGNSPQSSKRANVEPKGSVESRCNDSKRQSHDGTDKEVSSFLSKPAAEQPNTHRPNKQQRSSSDRAAATQSFPVKEIWEALHERAAAKSVAGSIELKPNAGPAKDQSDGHSFGAAPSTLSGAEAETRAIERLKQVLRDRQQACELLLSLSRAAINLSGEEVGWILRRKQKVCLAYPAFAHGRGDPIKLLGMLVDAGIVEIDRFSIGRATQLVHGRDCIVLNEPVSDAIAGLLSVYKQAPRKVQDADALGKAEEGRSSVAGARPEAKKEPAKAVPAAQKEKRSGRPAKEPGAMEAVKLLKEMILAREGKWLRSNVSREGEYLVTSDEALLVISKQIPSIPHFLLSVFLPQVGIEHNEAGNQLRVKVQSDDKV